MAKKFITVKTSDNIEETFIFSGRIDHPEYFDMLKKSSYGRFEPKLVSAGFYISSSSGKISLYGDSGLLREEAQPARPDETQRFLNQL